MDAGIAAVVAALVGLSGVFVAALLSWRRERQRRDWEMLLVPSEKYANAVLSAMAALRYLTPPSLPKHGKPPHRNEVLTSARSEKEHRIARCYKAVDLVRVARSHVRLSFHPSSRVSALADEILDDLRWCLEAAEDFYARHEMLASSETSHWRKLAGERIRKLFLDRRDRLYETIDVFFQECSIRLSRPDRREAPDITGGIPRSYHRKQERYPNWTDHSEWLNRKA